MQRRCALALLLSYLIAHRLSSSIHRASCVPIAVCVCVCACVCTCVIRESRPLWWDFKLVKMFFFLHRRLSFVLLLCAQFTLYPLENHFFLALFLSLYALTNLLSALSDVFSTQIIIIIIINCFYSCVCFFFFLAASHLSFLWFFIFERWLDRENEMDQQWSTNLAIVTSFFFIMLSSFRFHFGSAEAEFQGCDSFQIEFDMKNADEKNAKYSRVFWAIFVEYATIIIERHMNDRVDAVHLTHGTCHVAISDICRWEQIKKRIIT